MRAYHICPSEFALSNIALQRLKIATYGDLNDPFELLSLSLGYDHVRHAFMKWKEEFSKNQGMLCFSKNWSNPVLWSHYGAKHTGICLGFDIDNSWINTVEYVGERDAVTIGEDGRMKFDEEFMNRLLRTKYEHWRYEEEVRAIALLDHGKSERGLYFIHFSEGLRLREIILGARCEIAPSDICRLASGLYEDVSVVNATLANKRYKVVAKDLYECP